MDLKSHVQELQTMAGRCLAEKIPHLLASDRRSSKCWVDKGFNRIGLRLARQGTR